MSSTVTRLNVIQSARSLLHAWPTPAILKQAITAQANSFDVTDDLQKEAAIPGGIIECEGEIMRLVSMPEDMTALRVYRGFMGTTAIAHGAGAVLNLFPSWGFADVELLKYLRMAIVWLKPQAWTRQVSASFSWTSGELTATPAAAAGISYPDGNFPIRVERQQSDSQWTEVPDWSLDGSILRFAKRGSGDTLRAIYAKFQGQLSADGTTLDSDDFEEALAYKIGHLALSSLGSNRIRYAEYAAALNDRASTPDEILRMGYNFGNLAERALERVSRPLPSGYASTFREPQS